jgi:ubiquitin C-terminal hydrolase
VEAIKKLDLWSSPDNLIIHLKRFAFDMKCQRWIKHETLIDYPVSDFDLSPFRIGPDQGDLYDLVAVSNHMGSMDRGHYTAFGQRGLKWYHFDDDIVTEVKKDDLVGCSGYLLFYQRKMQ